MKPIRTAVIGAGKVGDVHAAVLASLPGSELVAVCSRTAEKAEALASKHGVKPYTSVSEMVAQSGVEAVLIATPHPAHAAPAIEALESGAHVLIEKPMAASLADCDAMIAASESHNRKLGIISQRRWYESSQRVRRAIDSGKIGKPMLAEATLLGWRSPEYYAADPWRGKWETEGGGVLVNQAPHQLDLLLWYMGEIEELFGYWSNINHPYIEVEDTAVAVVRFKNGGLGNIQLSNAQKPGLYGRVRIHGDNGASVGVQTDGGSMFIAGMTSIAEPPVNDLWTIPDETDLLAGWQAQDRTHFENINAIEHYFGLQIQDFLDAIRDDRPPMVTGMDGRRVVELFTAIYRSQQSSDKIRFPL